MKKIVIIPSITDIEIIAVSNAIRDLHYLEKAYGKGKWKKYKGVAEIKYFYLGKIHLPEIALGIGHCGFKMKHSEEIDK